jgi:iron(III) transport system ATP-binding protein
LLSNHPILYLSSLTLNKDANMIAESTTSSNSYLSLSGVSKYFGSFAALSDVSFEISEGEFICFLGPSGCGKTTLLRCIAGLETQNEGTIILGGKDISWLPPSSRDFGIVFQSYALFPNLKVSDNITYGLVNQKISAAKIQAKCNELLELVDLTEHVNKYPAQLSGGQQQRVALARALATSPGLLLLDEPLSALDAKVRSYLRREIREIQNRLGVTTIMVTHDQEEAQSMADRIIVINEGRIEQTGTPGEIYDHPATPFIADFIGTMNFVPAVVAGINSVDCEAVSLKCDVSDYLIGAKLSCAIRPEDIIIGSVPEQSENAIDVTITEIENLGSFSRLFLNAPALGSPELIVDVRKDAVHQHLTDWAPDKTVQIHIPADNIRIYPVEV